ncbi:MAG: holo-ACP synthase [Candidatus Eisenbacteria bacterium]|nr:holo-ACP synthase [Candidatus Eisenbacteria bacterium]
MAFSVGIDIVEIERIRQAVDVHAERFLRKVFSSEEISFCLGRADSMACLAARFAAKEAFKKAIRASIPVAWREIAVLPESDGGPTLRLVSSLGDRLDGHFTLSLSHSRDYAVAVVLWERT